MSAAKVRRASFHELSSGPPAPSQSDYGRRGEHSGAVWEGRALEWDKTGHASVGDSVLFRRGAGDTVRGVVRYAGPLEGAPGEWLGVELERPVGRHSGRGLFECAPGSGIFVRQGSAGVDVTAPAQSHLPPVGPLFTEYLHLLQKEWGDAMICSPPPERIGPEDALVVVDLQYDFLPGGTFGVPEGDHTTFAAGHLIEKCAERGVMCVVTRDYHPIDHASFTTHGGPFPPHCVQGSRGAELCVPVAAALASARRRPRGAELAQVVFKGYHADIDSFGAFQYADDYAEGRLAKRVEKAAPVVDGVEMTFASGGRSADDDAVNPANPHSGCALLGWTGCSALCTSSIDLNINAPPDVTSVLGRKSLREVIGTRRRLYVIGLALDFCVLDTAITAKTAGFGEVWIVLDLARAAHVGGFLTPVAEFKAKLMKNGIRLCWMEDML